MKLVMVLAVAWLAGAQERVTEGELKLVIDAPAGIAREGPSWDPAGFLYFVGNNKVSRLDLQGKLEAFLDPSPGANGSLVDSQKRVLVCESQGRRVVRVDRDHSVTVLADSYEGKKFNSPNDLAIDS